MQATNVSPYFLFQTLKQRGLPPISLEAVRFRLQSLGPDQHFQALVLRLHNGIEHPADMEIMANWCRETNQLFAKSSPPTEPVIIKPALSSIDFDQPEVQENKGVESPDISRDLLPDPERHKRLHPDQRKGLRHSHHVYGSRAAMCIEPTQIEDMGFDQRTPTFHTLSIEMAAAKDNHFDWDTKIVFRLTKRELPLFIAMMMGWIDGTLSMANHGNEKDKTLEICDQGANIYAKLRQAKRAYAIPIPAEEIFAICTLALSTLARNTPQLDSQTLIHVIKRAAGMHKKKADR